MSKNKKELKSNLLKSFKEESISIDERFAKADNIILNKSIIKNKDLKEKVVKCTFTIHPEVINRIDDILINAAKEGCIMNKSEVVRLAINNLFFLSQKDKDSFIKNLKVKSKTYKKYHT